MDCFLGGLKEEIRLGIQELQLQSLKEVIMMARVEEAKLKAWVKRSIMGFKMGMPGNQQKPSFVLGNKAVGAGIPGVTNIALHNMEFGKNLPIKGLTREQIAEKRKKLCYSCDEPYIVGHQCKKPHPFLMLPSQVDCDSEGGKCCEEEKPTDDKECKIHEAHITLHALSGHRVNNTIRILGLANGKCLRILIDSGKRIKAPTQDTKPMTISIANGFKVESMQECNQLLWSAQGESFITDFRILPLGRIDAVMGVQWLKHFNPVTFDFDHLQLSFIKDDKEVVLRGESDSTTPTIQLMSSGEFQQALNTTTHGYFGYLFRMSSNNPDNEDQPTSKQGAVTSDGKNRDSSQLDSLLQNFSAVFKELQELPPNRTHNLKEGSQLINLRPYRYHHVQKEEIEKIVNEMLVSGIIQQSTSPYAFPVLLVKKQDGTWRMCVDYRSLNEMTVKDKFPIPAIDELLDELQGSKWYSKLNLRSGYHQIKVHPPRYF